MVEQIINRYGASFIIEKLAPFVTDLRQQRILHVLSHRLHSIRIAVETPADIHNALAIVRSAEVFGIMDVTLIQPENTAAGIRGITQGAFEWTHISYDNTLEHFIKKIKRQPIKLAGACLTSDLPLDKLPVNEPLCLLFGNEHLGLSAKAKAACDYIFHIPMVGMTESLNLSVAAAISLYDISKRKRQTLKQNGDLTDTQFKYYQACYYLKSVNPKMITALLNGESIQ